MLKRTTVYYDSKTADPTTPGVSHLIIEEGKIGYITATLYITRRLEVSLKEGQRLVPIGEAREKYDFREIMPPYIDQRAIRELEEERDQEIREGISRRIGRKVA
ncbi:MAG: hypothetical protein AABW73_04260 [Nanoarchaeota archaeon]